MVSELRLEQKSLTLPESSSSFSNSDGALMLLNCVLCAMIYELMFRVSYFSFSHIAFYPSLIYNSDPSLSSLHCIFLIFTAFWQVLSELFFRISSVLRNGKLYVGCDHQCGDII